MLCSIGDKVSTDGKRQVRGAGGVRQAISLKEMHERNSRLVKEVPYKMIYWRGVLFWQMVNC